MFKKNSPVLISVFVLILSFGAVFFTWNTYSQSLPVNQLSSIFEKYLLAFGMIGSFSLFGIVLSLLTSRKRAVDFAEIMTASLRTRTKELESIKESIEAEKIKLSIILSSMGECLIAVSDEGKIILINQIAQTTLGVAEADAIGKNIEEILKLMKEKVLIPKNDYPVYKAMKEKEIARLYSHDNVYLQDKISGKVFPIILSAISTLNEVSTGGVAAIIVFHDISVEKAIDEAKTEFVSLAAHQLRMPLTAIRWYAELLTMEDAGSLNTDQKSYISEIYQSNSRMINLVNQLLSVSRIRLGTFKIDPKPMDLDKIVESVIAELKPEIVKKNMHVVKDYGADLEMTSVDPDLLHVILQNLISNAIKYTPEKGTVTISISTNMEFTISVSDTGYGIPKHDSDKIFTQLYRAENIKGRDVEGTGLGLYMVKTIVDQVGGVISFNSEENKGTTFRITFPKSGMRARGGINSLA